MRFGSRGCDVGRVGGDLALVGQGGERLVVRGERVLDGGWKGEVGGGGLGLVKGTFRAVRGSCFLTSREEGEDIKSFLDENAGVHEY